MKCTEPPAATVAIRICASRSTVAASASKGRMVILSELGGMVADHSRAKSSLGGVERGRLYAGARRRYRLATPARALPGAFNEALMSSGLAALLDAVAG